MAAACRVVCLCADTHTHTRVRRHTHMSVFHTFAGEECWSGGEIYLSEQWRIEDGDAQREKNNFKEKGKCRKGEIYSRVRLEHIKVKGLESEK